MLFLTVLSELKPTTPLSVTKPVIDSDFLARALQSLSANMAPGGGLGPAMGRGGSAGPPRTGSAGSGGAPLVPHVPIESVRELMAMGFSESRSRKALLLNNLDVGAASEWIVDHIEDPVLLLAVWPNKFSDRGCTQDIDAPLSEQQIRQMQPDKGSQRSEAREGNGQNAEALRHFENVFRAIALVANGDDRPREKLEKESLPEMESAMWMISGPTKMIWSGVRDETQLVAGIDENSASFVRRILSLLSLSKEQLLGDNPNVFFPFSNFFAPQLQRICLRRCSKPDHTIRFWIP